MAKKVISEDTNEQWQINGAEKTWTLEKQAAITVAGAPAIALSDQDFGNTLKLFGDVSSTGAGIHAIEVAAFGTTILIGEHSKIKGATGIDSVGGDTKIVNRGVIEATDFGIDTNINTNIRNFGHVSGNYAILGHGDDSRVVNGAGGTIEGATVGLYVASGEGADVINKGTISGQAYAVVILSDGENTFINTGNVEGDILFGAGNDMIDTRKGNVNGQLIGGDSNDEYRISKGDAIIVEEAGEGYDGVRSSATFSLDDHIEALYLTGKKNVSGFGNDEDNNVFGNRGDNTLVGGAGDDLINGGRGTDAMIGEDGFDSFLFIRGDGKDTIGDFTFGEDIIWLNKLGNVDFSDLDISQHGENTWISLGKGDRIVLSGIDADQLTEDNFSFLPLGPI
ncbi:calcium-binding protein [Rhizobium sp. TH2]|uniref:calcium-binding protein n=1 Tax=Rhizobium sp. TH2 TaxID=2775403 RepID=UPI0021586C10|nr:calcium-binding protein [Rhizobium sp. TH2]UVC10065.1 calcium-binding protein [Rhizobium sp. TH2]